MIKEEKNIFHKGNNFQINFKNGVNSININKNDLNNILKISDIKNIDNFLHINIDKNTNPEDNNIKENNNYNKSQFNINGNNVIISSSNENNNENGSFNYNNYNNNFYNNNYNDKNNYNYYDNNDNNNENIYNNDIKGIETNNNLNNSQKLFQYNKISNQSLLNDSNNNINNIDLTNNNLNYSKPNLIKFTDNKENSSILSEILEFKKQGNEHIKTNNPLKAIEFYDKAISKINEFLAENENENENEINTDDLKTKIKLQYKLILSNKSQSLFKLNKINESIEIDKFIIENLDNKFDKSYARLINNYLILDQIETALKYKEQLKNIFSQEVILKYNDILENLEKKEKEKNENMMNFMKKSKKNENKKINEFENNQQISRRYKKLFNYMSMFFSGVLFVSSGYALYLLYSNRKKFI